jgi:hypothetical protein
LEADSIAEAWWDALDVGQKGSWADVKAVFRSEWPPSRVQDVSTATKQDIMMSMKVTEEDIGKMGGEGRWRDYTHVIWADKVEPLWKHLDDRNGLLIPEVRTNLLQSLIDCLPDVAGINRDFKIFLQAVRDAPIEKVTRRTEELKRIHKLEQQVSSLSQSWVPPSPMSKMTQKFSSASLHTPTYPYNSYTRPTLAARQTQTTTSGNASTQPAMNPSTPYVPPFCRQTPPHTTNPIQQQPTPANSSSNPFDDNATPRPNNSFFQRLQEQQTSPLARKGSNSHQLAQSASQLSRLYPDDKTGHVHYTRDIAAWETAFGKDAQMMFTKDPLPLTPGSSALGSQECYQCGKATNPAHIGADCSSPIRIPQRESSWCNYINKILFPVGLRGNMPRTPYYQCDHASVAPIYATEGEYIEYDPYLYPIDNVTFTVDAVTLVTNSTAIGTNTLCTMDSKLQGV